MKSKILKYLVLSSALVFMNCGDDAAEAVANAIGDTGLESSASADPIDPPNVADSASGTVESADSMNADPANPACSASVNPEDPATTDPATPTSSDVTDPFAPADPASSASVDPNTPVDSLVTSSAAETPASSNTTPTKGGDSKNPNIVPIEKVSSSSEQEVESSSSEAPKGIFLAEGTEEEKDQMEVVYQTDTGDDGKGILAYPKRLSDTQKHGVVLWGPGGGEMPSKYEGIIRRLASHGFVVIATSESPDGTDRGKPALDWLAKKNETPGDPLYQKLDMTKVGASGHSMGGLQSEEMLIADSRVITAVLNNSGDMGHNDGTRVPTTKTFAIVYGEGGMERPNAEADYGNPGVKAPACLLKMTGGQGNECQNGECGYGHGSGPWDGMAATVAWMRWHLGGEDFRKSDFVGSIGKYIDGPIIGKIGKWKGQCKNF